ncbi:MAG: YdbH domain-containing protein [Kiritimatiellae bacterium]|nr:YdbH domain-containing protein [Kiritimatiellia bacterium]
MLFFLLAGISALLFIAWQQRVGLATSVMRKALDRHGLQDVSFRLARLDWGCVAVEDFRWGDPASVLEIARAEIRFTVADVFSGYVENVRVSGVRTRMIAEGGRLVSPLQEKAKALLMPQTAAKGTLRKKTDNVKTPLRSCSVQDMQVEVVLAGGVPVTVLTVEGGALAETDGKYRVWGNLCEGGNVRAGFEGAVQTESGTISLNPDVDVKNVMGLVNLTRLVAPEQVASLPVVPTDCSLNARGSLAIEGWTNAGPFEISAELGRNSTFQIPGKDRFVRFQTLRVVASGMPDDVQARVSAGVSGFRLGGDRQVVQEEGRLLSLRGNVQFRREASNQRVNATFDSDLPGRSVSKFLPRLLPLVPRLFTEGGTLHAEGEVARFLRGGWNGAARFRAEARRSTVKLEAGRAGAGCVAVSGEVAVKDGCPGAVRTDVAVEDGYFFKRGASVRGGGTMRLTAYPPYTSASGRLSGQVGETHALTERGVTLPDGAVRFEGDAEVTGLMTNPVWRLKARIPEFGCAVRKGAVAVQTLMGAAAEVNYSTTRVAVEGGVWARDTAVSMTPSGSVKRAEAGVERIGAHVRVPACDPLAFSNAVVQVVLDVSNGWAHAGEQMALEGLCASVPLTWSVTGGVTFLAGHRLTWQRWETAGIRLLPGIFNLESLGNTVGMRTGARVADSAAGVQLGVRLPLETPQRAEITVALPETEVVATDGLAALVRDKMQGAEVTARVAADAQVRFMGSQPHVMGRVRVADGHVKKGDLSVEGLTLNIPFESGVFLRTIERPSLTFTKMKAGNIRLDKGVVAFQVTPEEVFIDRMEVSWCKGSLNAYSVHLNRKDPKDEFVVYADRIDLGEALMMVMPFKGKIEGVLYGRFPVGFDNGQVRLSTGFLYSLPGQGGVLKLDDSAPMVSLLNRAGITGDVQQPLSKALSDMDFSAIRMELEPKTAGDAVLRLKLDGKSNYKEWPAPVALNLNLHGPLEQLVNVGLDLSKK